MASNRQTEAEFRRSFIERTKEARKGSGYTQDEVARLLRIPQDRYKQYETRTPMPHYYIPDFCIATDTSIWWLFGISGQTWAKQRRRLANQTT